MKKKKIKNGKTRIEVTRRLKKFNRYCLTPHYLSYYRIWLL